MIWEGRPHAFHSPQPPPNQTVTTSFAILAVLLILPLAVIWHLTKSEKQKAREMKSRGWKVPTIAAKFGKSERTIYRWTAA